MADVNNDEIPNNYSNIPCETETIDPQDTDKEPKENGDNKISAENEVAKEKETETECHQDPRSPVNIERDISALTMEKLPELREENEKLKRELEELKRTPCGNKCGSDSVDSNSAALIAIHFLDKSVAEQYKHKFVEFLTTTLVELNFTEDDLRIDIIRNDLDANTSPDDKSPTKKRKRKKSKSKSQTDLFVVDRTPSVNRIDHNYKYTSKYLVMAENLQENTEKSEDIKCPPMSVCFNCEQNHSLRDCPLPKNFIKINIARNKLKQQQTKTRYHMDDDQKYAHLRPGEISGKLRSALGIYPDELPPYVYRMRVCGYPPGWMEDAWVTNSNISLFGIDGKELNVKNCKTSIDPNKVVEYPGFNMPPNSGVKDDYESFACPPYSEKYNKSVMLDFIKKKLTNEQDNLESCDMELDPNSDDPPSGCEPRPQAPANSERLSPSLVDLEQKKMELLAELDDSTVEEKTDQTGKNCNDSIEIPSSYIIIDDIENDPNKSVTANVVVEELRTPRTPTVDPVRRSTFGTPIVKSASPYNSLPNPENFSKDISPVINFENLPNSTGKYEQMTTILQKVRRTLKSEDL